MSDGMTCAACKWNGGEYLQLEERTHDVAGLRCRRHAPVITGGTYGPTYTAWPTVRADDTCGDFQWPEEADAPVPF